MRGPGLALALVFPLSAVVGAAAMAAPAPGALVSAGPAPVATAADEPHLAAHPVSDTAAPTVILLHGLGRTHRSMGAMARSLEDAGYRVVNLGYPSRHHPVPVLVDSLAAELQACCSGDTAPLHFVTHSLGGILVRAYRQAHGSDRIGRVVMLSPPNQGSQVVDRIPQPLMELVLGPAAIQLGTDSLSVPTQLPPVDFELGIITGDATMNPLFSWWLPGDDDGKVSVESARIDGADAFLVVPYSHTWIMQREHVIEQVLAFLAQGRFDETDDPDATAEPGTR